VLYELVDLQKTPVAGKFYYKQLLKSPPPAETEYFFIEKILKSRKVKGKTQYLVKYLYYPQKFNKWIPAENLVTSDSL